MSRIPPVPADRIPEGSRRLLARVGACGRTPNLLRILAHSPVALEAYLALGRHLDRSSLPEGMRERIGLAMAEFNRCEYSLSEHIDRARSLARLSDAEITANRSGYSNDPIADAALRFAVAIASERGRVSEAQLGAFRSAGYDHAQALEIVHHVAFSIFSDYVNEMAATEIDVPLIRCRRLPVSPGLRASPLR